MDAHDNGSHNDDQMHSRLSKRRSSKQRLLRPPVCTRRLKEIIRSKVLEHFGHSLQVFARHAKVRLPGNKGASYRRQVVRMVLSRWYEYVVRLVKASCLVALDCLRSEIFKANVHLGSTTVLAGDVWAAVATLHDPYTSMDADLDAFNPFTNDSGQPADATESDDTEADTEADADADAQAGETEDSMEADAIDAESSCASSRSPAPKSIATIPAFAFGSVRLNDRMHVRPRVTVDVHQDMRHATRRVQSARRAFGHTYGSMLWTQPFEADVKLLVAREAGRKMAVRSLRRSKKLSAKEVIETDSGTDSDASVDTVSTDE
ncbi:hypothetical protein BC831DRAFT_472737 [Entophlyctis helioformis]|nr:hypothetical protein BC831DRAFT_472737 [Entophlyctis helioformis]